MSELSPLGKWILGHIGPEEQYRSLRQIATVLGVGADELIAAVEDGKASRELLSKLANVLGVSQVQIADFSDLRDHDAHGTDKQGPEDRSSN